MKNIRKLYKITLPLLFVTLCGVLSCDQDPIFYIISQEVAPLDPRIKASPTNMVIFSREYADSDEPVTILYVASGRLHWYAQPIGGGEPEWDSPEHSIPQLDGRIIDLAVTADYLYALSLPDSGTATTLQRIGKADNNWEPVAIADDTDASNYPLLQSIYADSVSTRLFAGSRSNNSASRAILYLDENDSGNDLKLLYGDATRFTGLASVGGDTYFLSTVGNGIYKVVFEASQSFTVEQLNNSDPNANNNLVFSGIFRLSDTAIIAVGRNGSLYEVDGNGFTSLDMNLGNLSSGALALWRDKDQPEKTLLLAGITATSTSYTGGYVEFDLTETGTINPDSERHEPGVTGSNDVTSVHNNERYAATIGKYPINHLFQAPKEIDPEMTLFASTQTAGLWSYRIRNGEWQWNAEE